MESHIFSLQGQTGSSNHNEGKYRSLEQIRGLEEEKKGVEHVLSILANMEPTKPIAFEDEKANAQQLKT